MSYHTTVRDVYREAATQPAANLCCVPQAPRYLPGLNIPPIMVEMNYGCGTTIHLQDMTPNQRVLYVGVGGGLEVLQLAYFARRPGGVIAVDPVREMRQKARANLELAAVIRSIWQHRIASLIFLKRVETWSRHSRKCTVYSTMGAAWLCRIRLHRAPFRLP